MAVARAEVVVAAAPVLVAAEPAADNGERVATYLQPGIPTSAPRGAR